MMHRACGSIVEVPYCFSRSYVKFQGHTALKIVEFDPNLAFPDSNSSLNLPMAMKCCTKLETVKERCPIVFQGDPSKFKVRRDKTTPILTQMGRFRTISRSQLSNPSDLPCSQWNVVCFGLKYMAMPEPFAYLNLFQGVHHSRFHHAWFCLLYEKNIVGWNGGFHVHWNIYLITNYLCHVI